SSSKTALPRFEAQHLRSAVAGNARPQCDPGPRGPPQLLEHADLFEGRRCPEGPGHRCGNVIQRGAPGLITGVGDNMCLEYYPECGDGGDGCCQRHLNVSRSLVEREAGELPRIYARRVDFQWFAA